MDKEKPFYILVSNLNSIPTVEGVFKIKRKATEAKKYLQCQFTYCSFEIYKRKFKKGF
jgi:hypothetical protein